MNEDLGLADLLKELYLDLGEDDMVVVEIGRPPIIPRGNCCTYSYAAYDV